MLYDTVKEAVGKLPGKIGVYYKRLNSGESFCINGDEAFIAASVIKLPILVEAFRQAGCGCISFDRKVLLRQEDKLPGCGVLRHLQEGLEITLLDACRLMIIFSDNTATNLLIKLLGMENINDMIGNMGLQRTRLNRLLFDEAAEKQGKQNYFTPREMGVLLEGLYERRIVSPEASAAMLDILSRQQMNHKLPYLIPGGVVIAHKTGEDQGTTHDVALFLTEDPFILCFAANGTDVKKTEAVMREAALACYEGN